MKSNTLYELPRRPWDCEQSAIVSRQTVCQQPTAEHGIYFKQFFSNLNWNIAITSYIIHVVNATVEYGH